MFYNTKNKYYVNFVIIKLNYLSEVKHLYKCYELDKKQCQIQIFKILST